MSGSQAWPAQTFEAVTDLVVVIDPSGALRYANPRAFELLRYPPEALSEANIIDFLHPDEVERAAKLLALLTDEGLGVPVSPAIWRVRRHDDTWLPLELNAATIGEPGDGLVALVGRYSGDRDLMDRMLRALTTGAPVEEVIATLPAFGTWRHPDDHYAVLYTPEGDGTEVVGSDRIRKLVETYHDADSPWATAAATGQSVVVTEGELPAALRAAASELDLGDVRAEPVADPLTGGWAVIVAWCRRGGPDLTVHDYPVELMAGALALLLQWRRQVSALREAARRDPLTGLANRTGFWERLEDLSRASIARRVGVLYVDLDGFKAVNDAHGHTVGDVVLAAVAKRIDGVLRPGDTVARLGGDEFGVVCQGLTGDRDLVTIAERALAALDEPFDALGSEVHIGASIGIATTDSNQLDPDRLLDAADRALYQAKRTGRGRWHLADDADQP